MLQRALGVSNGIGVFSPELLERRLPVIVVGPPLDSVGGMTSVVHQQLAWTPNDFVLTYEPTTVSQSAAEAMFARVVRHVRHAGRFGATLSSAQEPIVHIHTCSGFSFHRSAVDVLVAKHHGCPVVLHIHGAAFDKFFDRSSGMVKCWIRAVLATADRVVALSHDWCEKLQAMAPRACVTVIENAVDVPRDPPDQARGSDVCHFVLLARMDEWKGIDDALEACAILRSRSVPCTITLAGPEGTAGDAATLKRKIDGRGLGGMVRYVGCVEGQDKERLLCDADAYIQPSHHEGMPMAVLEALACGLPIVATSVGAMPEVITEGVEGILVPPRDPVSFAGAMEALVVDAPRRMEMARCAHELARRRFSQSRFHADLHRMYCGLQSQR